MEMHSNSCRPVFVFLDRFMWSSSARSPRIHADVKTQSRTPVETALTCSPNSQLTLLFLVKNALELTELLAPDHGSNNTIMPGSSSSRRCQGSEEGGLRLSGVGLTRPSWDLFIMGRKSATSGLTAGRGVQEETSARLCHLAQGPKIAPSPLHHHLIFSDIFCPLASGPNTKAKNNTFQTTVCAMQGQSEG